MTALVRRLAGPLVPAGGVRVRIVVVVVVIAAALAWGIRLGHGGTGGTSRGAIASAGAVADEASALSRGVTDAWLARVRPDGRLLDAHLGLRGDYGTEMLATGMLREGARTGDQHLIAAGVRVLSVQVKDPSLGGFELMALSDLYAWGQSTLPSVPAARGAWAQLEPQLRQILGARTVVSANPQTVGCLAASTCFGNQKLVAGVAIAGLLATDLPAVGGGALLADQQAQQDYATHVLDLVADHAGTDVERVGAAPGRGGGILSDPLRNPLAYDALSLAMLGRLLRGYEARGYVVPSAALAAFDRVARGFVLLAAPDGDLSYLGRGQGQVWVPAVAVEAAAEIVRRSTDDTLRRRALAVAAASLQRLRSLHLRPDGSLSLVPGTASEGVPAGRGVDAYAGKRTYDGLAVFALDDAARLLHGVDLTASAVPQASDGITLASEQAGLATITRGTTWSAVAGHAGAGTDARYGPGLLAVRRRDAHGVWRDAIPARPFDQDPLPTLSVDDGAGADPPDGAAHAAGTSSVIFAGAWRSPVDGIGDLDATNLRWTVGGDGSVGVRLHLQAPHTVVVRLLVPRGASARLDGEAVAITAGDGIPAQHWTLALDGRAPTGATLATTPVAGSAYARGLSVATVRFGGGSGAGVALTLAG